MENNILAQESGPSAADRAVERSLEGRRASAEAEISRLVAATLHLIEQTGQVEPRVSEIVSEAGLSNQAFYRHFRSKHELLVAVLDEGIRILATYLGHRMASAATPVDAVREWVRGLCAQALDVEGARASQPFATARGRLVEAFPEEVASSQERLTAPLRGALLQARDAGQLSDVDPVRDAEALYHLCMGWLQTRLLAPGETTVQDAEALERFALAGVGVHSGRGE